MENFVHKATEKLPELNFDAQKGELFFKGTILIPYDDAREFFKPIFDWIEEYIKNPRAETNLYLDLGHVDDISKECIRKDIFKMFEKIHKNGNKVIVNWYYYCDKDTDEGEEAYQFYTVLDFKFIDGGGGYFD